PSPTRLSPTASSTLSLHDALPIFGCALVVRLRAFRAFLAAAGLWILLTLVAFGAFAVLDVWLQAMAATVALVLGYGGTVTEHFVDRKSTRLNSSHQIISYAVFCLK